jgi:hypothetical protein
MRRGVLLLALVGVVGCTSAPPAPATSVPATVAPAPAKPTVASASPVPQAAASPAASPSAQVAASPAAKPAASPAVVASPSPVAAPTGPSGERLVEQSAEARFQLDLAVPDAALATYLPAGFTPNVATTGAAKDANLRAVFIDRVTVNGPTGAPVGSGSNRLVYLVAPVRDTAGAAAQLVIGGITEDPLDAPGPFGNYVQASVSHTMQRSSSAGQGVMDSQDWVFEAGTGEHLELHVKYERGNAQRGAVGDTRFYSSKSPSFYQLSRQEQVLDILRNVTTTPPDRVKEFAFKCSYAKLCDGTERVLSWDNILWINRAVFQP